MFSSFIGMREHTLSAGPTAGRLFTAAGAISILIATGCGKESESNGMGGYSVNAVIAPVEPTVLEEKIFLIGSLEAIDEVDLVSEIDARVVELNFDEGEAVEAGQLLIRLDARKLEASVAEMRARFQLARADLERSAMLLERETIPSRIMTRQRPSSIPPRPCSTLQKSGWRTPPSARLSTA